jgi:HD-GYP domain-containing protein (c-di-GMP phosphodiesterase class II)
MKKIEHECDKINDFSFKISIALGSAEKNEMINAEAVMAFAEERMYRVKLTEIRSSRNATIMSLEKALYEKHSDTEEHTQRIKNLCLSLGKILDLSQDKLHELELLSLLHDIGKIGIPENILMKEAQLTSEEWEIMKKHSEIGYRIAKATDGLSHVANEILSHHEKYDGTGYPNGLKGEDIPILSRIINVVDSFDVMTHNRCYKNASSIEYAIEELKNCSGTQFDPRIADIFITMVLTDKS